MDALDFSNRVVVVTGGTKGVGRAIASGFAEAGAQVIVVARTRVELPKGWHFESADIRDGQQSFDVVDRIVETYGAIDVAINNAGGSPPADTTTASPRFTQRVVELNLLSAMYIAQRTNLHMQQGAGGSIINIASVTALRPAPTVAAYGAAKAGLINFTRTAGQEWAPKVRVNSVTPGLILTDQSELHYGDDDSMEEVIATIPMRRLADPVDIGNACLYLASPLSAYVTGANIVLDGGGDWPAFLRR